MMKMMMIIINRLPVQTSDIRKAEVKSTQEVRAFRVLPVAQSSRWKIALDQLFETASRGQVLHQPP